MTQQMPPKSIQNVTKKHTEKLTTQFQPKVRELLPKGGQKTTDKGGKGRDPGWNPPRKKKNTAKTRPTAGKGCMREGNTQTVTQCQHAPAVGRTRPGGESRLPAAIVPPPGLGKIICMRKICKKFDARSMQLYFFAKYCLKRLISLTTSQNDHPKVQNNQNMALHGTKRDPI